MQFQLTWKLKHYTFSLPSRLVILALSEAPAGGKKWDMVQPISTLSHLMLLRHIVSQLPTCPNMQRKPNEFVWPPSDRNRWASQWVLPDKPPKIRKQHLNKSPHMFVLKASWIWVTTAMTCSTVNLASPAEHRKQKENWPTKHMRLSSCLIEVVHCPLVQGVFEPLVERPRIWVRSTWYRANNVSTARQVNSKMLLRQRCYLDTSAPMLLRQMWHRNTNSQQCYLEDDVT